MLKSDMKVLLGMSGGIDSSVAAMLLMEQGFQVIGATLRLWSQTDNSTTDDVPSYITDAVDLAQTIGIEHYVIDVRTAFFDLVIRYFKNEYLSGKTPNPCAKCNVVLKWHQLNKLAERLNCEYIATGHYVNKIEHGGNFYITKGLDPDKEQSFFLWGLDQRILKKAIFPLGGLSKQQVKEKALEKGFVKLHGKKESTGVCFLSDKKYHSFLAHELSEFKVSSKKGNFITKKGEILGEHLGFPYYTVGQRRGLGLISNDPLFVTEILPKANEVRLGSREDLYKTEMLVEAYNIIDKKDFEKEVITRIRYRKQSALSRVEFLDNATLRVIFNKPEWSIAPGQTAAFYCENKLLGGGFILG